MDELFLTFSVLASIYCLYNWAKNKDKDYLHFAMVGIFIIILLISKLFLIDFLPEEIKLFFNPLIYCSWFLVIAASIILLRKI